MSPNVKRQRRDLFIKDDGSALVFHIPPGQTKKELIPLIEHGGGVVTSRNQECAIRLADKNLGESAVKYRNLFWPSYVLDCVNQNKLLDLEQYRCSNGTCHLQKMTDSETDSDMSPATTIIKMPHGKRGRAAFSVAEDLKILQYVVENRLIDKTGGKAIWKQMESLKLTKHSGESMRSHFLRKMMNTLDTYDIPNQWKSYLTGNTAVTAIDSEKAHLSDNSAKSSTPDTENTDAETRKDETGVVEETPEMRSGSSSVMSHSSDQGSQTSISKAVLSACSNSSSIITNSTPDDLHHNIQVDLDSEEYDDFDKSLLQIAEKSSRGSTTEQSGLSPKANSMEYVSEKQNEPDKSHPDATKAKEKSQVTKDVSLSFDDSDFIFDSDQTESSNQKKQSEEKPQNRFKRRENFQQYTGTTFQASKSKKHLFAPETHTFSVDAEETGNDNSVLNQSDKQQSLDGKATRTSCVHADVSTQKKTFDKDADMAADSHGQHKYHVALRTRSGIVSKQNRKANGSSSGKKRQKRGAPSSQNLPKKRSRKKKKDDDDDESELNYSDTEEKPASATSKGSSEKQLIIVLSSSECEKVLKAKSLSVTHSTPKRNPQPSAAFTPTTSPRQCSRLSLSSSKVLPASSPQKEGSSTPGSQRSRSTPPSDSKMRKREGSNNQSVSARKRLQLAPDPDSSLENDSFTEDKQTVELLAQEFDFTLSEACTILWQFSGNREAARYWIMTDHLLRGHYIWTEEDDKAVLESGADFSHLEHLKQQRGEAAVNARRQWLQEDS